MSGHSVKWFVGEALPIFYKITYKSANDIALWRAFYGFLLASYWISVVLFRFMSFSFNFYIVIKQLVFLSIVLYYRKCRQKLLEFK